MNPEITKIIEQYLAGELSSADKATFEERMASNKELREEVDLQKSIHEAAKRAAVRSEVISAAKKYHFLRKLKWGGIGLGAILLVTMGTLLLTNRPDSNHELTLDQVTKLTEELVQDGPIDNLGSEFFAWNANDTAFLSKDGILVSVPENAFLLNGKPYRDPAVIQWQEALDGSTIVKSGLSTTSNGILLETQGMFSFSAKTPEGKQLTINPKVGIYVQVPVDEYKEGMQLFDGVKDPSGNINWVEPRDLEKIPVPVDMADLDFYPPEYEAKLNELKTKKTKDFRDSLYLSFENVQSDKVEEEKPNNERIAVSMPLYLIPQRPITEEEMYRIYGRAVPINNNMGFDEAFILRYMEYYVDEDLRSFPVSFFLNDEQGRLMLYSQAMKSEVLEKFLKDKGYPIDNWYNQSNGENDTEQVSEASAEAVEATHIPPSSVLAFWKTKFNKTILATREFEARMKEIHRTCDKSVLDVYLRNLNKPMYELDEKVVAIGYSNFKQFANQKVGPLNANSPHIKGLEAFYDQAIKQLQRREKSLRDAESNKRNKWDQKVNSERQKEGARTAQREAQVFNEEYRLNHKNVRKQLGRVLGATIYGDSPISNIDRFVRETTLARKTNEYYDPVTGNTAKIQYNEFKFTVSNSSDYKQLYAYLFPHQLNSYHRIDGRNGVFSYPLNDAIMYDLAIVGISEAGYSYVQRTTLKGGDLGEIKLERVSEEKLDASVRQLNAKRGLKSFDVKQELRWLKTEQENYVEQKRRSDIQQFRNKVRPSVFPCAFETIADSTSWGVK